MAFLNKFYWYSHRLISMSLPEIDYRIRQHLKTWQDRHYYKSQINNASQVLPTDGWQTFWQDITSPFFFSEQDREKITQYYQGQFSSEYQATLQTVQSLLVHQITLFENQFDLDTEINWQRDPKTGNQWPYKFYADIDIRDGKTVGGVKWVWELNRHHHLVTLAKAYFLSGDETYAQEVCAQLQSWLQANPPGYGVNWTSSLELALRIINWAWILAFIRQSKTLTQSLFVQLMQSVVEQARYISRHLSAFSSANNHLIGEAAGLAVAGLAFPYLPDSKQWCDKGLNILTQEIERQIHPDGVPAEQATNYLAFVLDFNLIVWRLAELNGFEIPKVWHHRLEVAADFIMYLMDERGQIPAIGDSDDAWVVRLDDRSDVNNFQSILTSAAIIHNRPDFKGAAGRWDEKNFWLFGEKGQQIYGQLPDEVAKLQSRVFESGGYTVMYALNRRIICDHAPLGYLATAAHGHADALNLLLSLNGRPLLIDPNTYAYQEGYEWRDYFRSTAAHNTILVDGQNQSEMQGTFLWGQRANTKQLHWQCEREFDFLAAEHDGYQKLGIIHRRYIFFSKPSWLVVLDKLLGVDEHRVEQLWHFCPDADLNVDGQIAQITLDNNVSTTLFWDEQNSQSIQISHFCGEKNTIQGWVSPHYSQLKKASVLSLIVVGKLPLSIEMVFYMGFPTSVDELQTQKSSILADFYKIFQEISR